MNRRGRSTRRGRSAFEHGTENGYVNRDCRCDPCTWAHASYRRGERPVFPAPVWFDSWASSAGSL